MKVEHIGISVPDPIAMGKWYAQHLGFRIIFSGSGDSDGVSFVIDRPDGTVLELFKLPDVPPIDAKGMQPIQLHLAVECENPKAEIDRLVQAGAQFVGECPRNSYPGEKFFVRDPWGFVLQVLNREDKLRIK